MKAIRMHEFGGPDVLHSDSIEVPPLSADDVLIKIKGAGVNPVDMKIRDGSFPKFGKEKLPLILGRDVSGTVEESGSGNRRWPRGMEIFALLDWHLGGYAEHVAVPAALCVSKPSRLNMLESASVPLAAMTAWQGLFDQGQLKQGQTVLIHAGSGGVGHFAVQFAKVRGAAVFATASKDNLDFVSSLGADLVIDYKSQPFEKVAKNVDMVFDLIGGETRERSWPVLKRGGIMVSTLGQPEQQQAAKHGVRASGYETQPDASQLNQIRDLIDAGKVSPTVTKTFPLDGAADAHRYLERKHPRGKLVLAVDS